MENQSDVTVLLVLKSREAFTPRWFDFHARAALSCPVIVGDGIPSAQTERLAAEYSARSGARAEYLPFDERSLADYYKKLYEMVRYASTKYVHLSANDDFVIPSGVRASARFLDTRADYVTCGGAVFGFFLVGESFELAFGEPVGRHYTHLGALGSEVNILGDTAEGRVIECLKDYAPTYYAVHRRDDLLAVLEELISNGIQDVRVAELFIALHLAVRGRQVLHRGYVGYLRQRNSSQTYASLPDFFDSAVTGTITQDFQKLLRSLATKNGDGESNLTEKISRALASHYRRQFQRQPGLAGVSAALVTLLQSYAYTIRAKIPLARNVMRCVEWSRFSKDLRAGGASEQVISVAKAEIQQALTISCQSSA